MNAREQIALRLSNGKREKGYTLGDICTKTGVSKPRISVILRGQELGTWHTVEKLIDALCPEHLDEILKLFGRAEKDRKLSQQTHHKVSITDRLDAIELTQKDIVAKLASVIELLKSADHRADGVESL